MTCKAASCSQNSLGMATAMPSEQLDLVDYVTKRKEALARAEALREQKKHELEQRGQQVRKYSWGGVPTGFHSVDHKWTSPDEDPRVLLVDDSQQRLSLSPSGGGRTPRQRRKPLLDTNIDGVPLTPKNREGELSSCSSVHDQQLRGCSQDGDSEQVGRVRCLACQCKHSASGPCEMKATSSIQDHGSLSLPRAKSVSQSMSEETSRRLSSETVSSSLSDAPPASSFQYASGVGVDGVSKLVAVQTVSPNTGHRHETPADDARLVVINGEPLGEQVKCKASTETGSPATGISQGSVAVMVNSSHTVSPVVPSKASSAYAVTSCLPGAGSSLSRESKTSTIKKAGVRGLISSPVDPYGSVVEEKGAAPSQEDRPLTAGNLVGVASDCTRTTSAAAHQKETKKKGGEMGNAGEKQSRHSEASLDGLRRRDSAGKKGTVESFKKSMTAVPMEHSWSATLSGMPDAVSDRVLGNSQIENVGGEDLRGVSSKAVDKVKQDHYSSEAPVTTGREFQRGREVINQGSRDVAGRRQSISGAVMKQGRERRIEDPYIIERVPENFSMEAARMEPAKMEPAKNVESENGHKTGEDARLRVPVNIEMAIHERGHPSPQRIHAENHAKHSGKEDNSSSLRRVPIEPGTDRRGGGKPGAEGSAPAGQGMVERGRSLGEKGRVSQVEGTKAGAEKFDPKGRGNPTTEGVGGRKPQTDKGDLIRKGMVSDSGGNDEGAKKVTATVKPEQPKKVPEVETEVRKYPQFMKMESARKSVLSDPLVKKKGNNGLIVEGSSEKLGTVSGVVGAAGAVVPCDRKKVLHPSETVPEKKGSNGLILQGVAEALRKGIAVEMRKDSFHGDGILKKKGSNGLLVEGGTEKTEARVGRIEESHSAETCNGMDQKSRPLEKGVQAERSGHDCGAEKKPNPNGQGRGRESNNGMGVVGGVADDQTQEKRGEKKSRRILVGRNDSKRDTSKKHSTLIVRQGGNKSSSLRQISTTRRGPYEMQGHRDVEEEQHQGAVVEETVKSVDGDDACGATVVEGDMSEGLGRVEVGKGLVVGDQERMMMGSSAEEVVVAQRPTTGGGTQGKLVPGERSAHTNRTAGSAKSSHVKLGRVSRKSSTSQPPVNRPVVREATAGDSSSAGRVSAIKGTSAALRKVKDASAAGANSSVLSPERRTHTRL